MTKQLYTILLFVFPFIGFSQDVELLKEYTSPISKTTFRLGDSITVGVASYSKNGNYRYKSIFVTEKGWSGYNSLTENLSYKSGVVVNIYSNQHHNHQAFKNAVVCELAIDNHANVFIPIDDAILSKEIVVFPNSKPIKYPAFDNRVSTILLIKSKKLNREDAMLKYVNKIEPEKYEEWNNNEFKYESEKNQYMVDVDSIFKQVNTKDTFTLILSVELNDYQFETNSFPVAQTITKYGKTVEFPLSSDKLIFSNFSEFSNIPAPRQQAEYFANSTTKSYDGKRSAIVILEVRLDKVLTTQRESGLNIGSNVYDVNEFSFTIVQLSCVDSDKFYYNYLGGK